MEGDISQSARMAVDRAPVRKWAKLRVWAGYVYLVCAVVFAAPEPVPAIAGIVLVLTGAALRLVASATLVKDTELVTHGLYAMTRNPLYLGSLLAGLGFAAMASSWWILAALLLVLVPLYIRMVRLEEDYLARLYPEAYPVYRRSVPPFLPRFRPLPAMAGTLDLSRSVRSREPATTVILIVLTALLLAWHQSWLPG